MEQKRYLIPIIVVENVKSHDLLGIDVLRMDTLKLVNSIKTVEPHVGLLKGYEVSSKPIYFQAQKVPIIQLVVAKLNKKSDKFSKYKSLEIEKNIAYKHNHYSSNNRSTRNN